MTRGSLTFNCARCHREAQKAGSGLRNVLGMRRHVCSKCAEAIDRTRAKAAPWKRAAA